MNQFTKGRSPSNAMFVKKVFAYKEHLNGHIESVHEGKKPFLCNDCGKVFTRKRNLIIHSESIHERKKQME